MSPTTSPPVAAPAPTDTAARFEYLTTTLSADTLQADLSALGGEGWELVSLTLRPSGAHMLCVFKRTTTTTTTTTTTPAPGAKAA